MSHAVAVGAPLISNLSAGRRLVRNRNTRRGARRHYSTSFVFNFNLSENAKVAISLSTTAPRAGWSGASA